MVCKTAFKPESNISNLTEISLLNYGEGFIAVKREDGQTLPNSSGIVIKDSNTFLNNEIANYDNEIANYDELTMLRLFYLGAISFTGLYLFYRIIMRSE